jgi:hypothetical protein
MQQTQKQILFFGNTALGWVRWKKKAIQRAWSVGAISHNGSVYIRSIPLWVLRIYRIMRCSFVRWEALLIAFLCGDWVACPDFSSGGYIPSPKKRGFVFTISFSSEEKRFTVYSTDARVLFVPEGRQCH